jgi:hypothetical protein
VRTKVRLEVHYTRDKKPFARIVHTSTNTVLYETATWRSEKEAIQVAKDVSENLRFEVAEVQGESGD